MISKTRQLEKFNELLKDKTLIQKCRVRLDHETVRYCNNGKRTKAQITEHTKIPLSLVSLFLEVPVEIWDSVMRKEEYWEWIGREFGPSVKESVMRRNGKNCPCGTKTYKAKITEGLKSY